MEGAIHRNSLMISDAFCTFDGMSTRTYDDKGNLRTDSGRGISRILYNWQDQPTEINFSDGHRISITYDGYGNKLQVDYMTAQPIVVGSMHINSYKLDSRTYYSHGRVFKQNVGNLSFLEMTSHPYGYFDGDGKPYYYLPDYQGNITMVTDDDGMVQSHSRYYPYGETITRFKASETTASPKTNFGQRYKYGGKEYETMYGLNSYDFGPRHLGADLAVWASPDRRQDSYHNLSPYAYCAGNPIRYADPTGCDTIDVAKKNGVWEIQQSFIVRGDDIIRVEDVLYAIYSKNEQNKRVIALNLEITEDYAIGVLHVSGTNATFLYVVPGGESSNVKGSKKRVKDGEYPIDNTSGEKWQKPGLGGDVANRGIRFHSGSGNLVAWTEGCFVLMEKYQILGKKIQDAGRHSSEECYIAFDIALGGVPNSNKDVHRNTNFPRGVHKILELRSIKKSE